MDTPDPAPLIDVTDVSLRDLFASDDSALAACVERLTADLDDDQGVLSSFQSFAS